MPNKTQLFTVGITVTTTDSETGDIINNQEYHVGDVISFSLIGKPFDIFMGKIVDIFLDPDYINGNASTISAFAGNADQFYCKVTQTCGKGDPFFYSFHAAEDAPNTIQEWIKVKIDCSDIYSAKVFTEYLKNIQIQILG